MKKQEKRTTKRSTKKATMKDLPAKAARTVKGGADKGPIGGWGTVQGSVSG